MAPELRKRKPVGEPVEAPQAKKTATKKKPIAKDVTKVKEVTDTAAAKVSKTKESAVPKPKANGKSADKPAVGDVIDLETFGGEFETNDGEKSTLKKLTDESKSGVVLFTYPKASTPGCTTQVCLFRDSYEPLTATGYAIYGLSKDSPKANTNFKTKQNLPYTLLCDPSAALIAAIGLNKTGGAIRGVFVVDKAGKVLAAEPGGPKATLDVVEKLLGGSVPQAAESKVELPTEDVDGANGSSKEDTEQQGPLPT